MAGVGRFLKHANMPVYALQAPKNISEGQLVASGLVHLVQVVARGVGVFALDGLQEILGFFDGCAQTEQVVVQVDDDGPEPASLGGHVPP